MPSSPFLPCSTGNTTSTGSSRTRPFSKATRPFMPLPGQKATGIFSSHASHSPVHSACTGPGYKCQLPSFFMPTASTSNFSLFRLFSTLVALMRETSCSLETPPNSTAMVLFANIVTPSHRFCGPRLLRPAGEAGPHSASLYNTIIGALCKYCAPQNGENGTKACGGPENA